MVKLQIFVCIANVVVVGYYLLVLRHAIALYFPFLEYIDFSRKLGFYTTKYSNNTTL